MKSYFWKFFICIVPCLLAAWVTGDAVAKYRNGEAGGFKFGPDLAGGTILEYAIDFTKSKGTTADTNLDVNLLAESLKRRIDPNDLFNIIIRPAGGEGRIEIVLPTGGVYRAQKAQAAWEDLMKTMRATWPIGDLDVPRGKTLELAERIQMKLSEKLWKTKLFMAPGAWKRLQEAAVDYWPELDPKESRAELDKIPAGDTEQFKSFLVDKSEDWETRQTSNSVDNWLKGEAWKELLHEVRSHWTFLEAYKSDLDRIPPDSIEQLIGFVQAKGSLIGQAGASMVSGLIGRDALDKAPDFPQADEVRKFIEDNYGPSRVAITTKIDEEMVKTGHTKDLTVEEVQRIKDLVAKVGSLEFRILANSEDDKEAERDAKNLIASHDPDLKNEIENNAKRGLPPPPPRKANSKEQMVYHLLLPHGNKATVTYTWVELGPQERRQLNLDNGARAEPNRAANWNEAQKYVKLGEAFQLHETGGAAPREALQGALFFGRKCEDRNMPEEERRKKEFEYFVLARDPEFDPNDPTETRRTPKINGDLLTSASAGQGSDMRPAVHFKFNNDGANLFGTLTRKNTPVGTGPEATQVKRHLAIVLDGLIMSAPTINSEIRESGQISGSFTQKEVDNLVNVLRAGRLPATLKPQPVSESTLGATLGQDTIAAGVRAIVIAFVAVIIFMIFYYRFAGVVASIALLANLLLTVGFMVSVQATFTLPGLAGVVLMLGMAVDANVLIYERLREERERGASLAQAIRNGYDRALPTIIDTHLSSIFTAVVLYVVGNDQLKGFGVSLTVGLIISLFTSLYMTHLLFDFWLSKGWLKKLSMLRLFARPNIDFMAIRNVMFVVTIALAALGITLFIGRLPNDLNIDFVGGTAFGGKLTKSVSVAELRAFVDEKNQKERLSVKAAEEPGSDGTRFVLTYTNPNEVRDISFANKAEGDTPEARAAAVQARASILPDASVEQIFGSDNPSTDNTTAEFNIRTSEKEQELVQASLDRLLRDSNGAPLLKKTYVQAEPIAAKKDVRFLFYDAAEKTKVTTGSPARVKDLFSRELHKAFGLAEKAPNPLQYEVFGEGKPSPEGGFEILRVKFESSLSKDQIAKVNQAVANTQREFEARPQPERLENFDSQLATETRYRAMWAVIASWGAIMLYLWFRFGNWTFGLAAVICLIHDLFITLGAIAACHFVHGTIFGDLLLLEDFKIDLPAVAALLTLVGYSVNDTIVVFDRIREVRGKNPDLTPQMINDSVNQTLSRTILASVTTWLVVFVLFVWGGPGVHLFAFVMVVGVIVGTYSSIYIASPLLLYLGEGNRSAALAPVRPGRPQTETATV